MCRQLHFESGLYDETTFYKAFLRDIAHARVRVVIESPFITARRFETLERVIAKISKRGVRVVVNTREPEAHDSLMREQAIACIEKLQLMGVAVLYTANLHRKIAIVDDILWEGSLNILSQNDSCEIMRRTASPDAVAQMIRFIKLSQWYNQG